jgi:hypothetical protein
MAPKGYLSGDPCWIISAAETALLNNRVVCKLIGFWSGVIEVFY